MKRTISILVFVICLLVIVVWADRKWPAGGMEIRNQVATNSGGASSSDSDSGLSDAALQTLPIPDVDGKNVTLSDYKGKVVLVDFWATWCDPCRIEIPWLIDMQQKYESRGFVILGVSMDEDGKKAVDPFLASERFDVNGQKMPINYQILLGSDDIADKFGGIIGMPTSMLFTRDGKKIKTFIGLTSYDEIDQAIQGQL
ncbi:MAG: TlpA disulfide reductase family protein [Candidatus Acidiferrales bacterium]